MGSWLNEIIILSCFFFASGTRNTPFRLHLSTSFIPLHKDHFARLKHPFDAARTWLISRSSCSSSCLIGIERRFKFCAITCVSKAPLLLSLETRLVSTERPLVVPTQITSSYLTASGRASLRCGSPDGVCHIPSGLPPNPLRAARGGEKS